MLSKLLLYLFSVRLQRKSTTRSPHMRLSKTALCLWENTAWPTVLTEYQCLGKHCCSISIFYCYTKYTWLMSFKLSRIGCGLDKLEWGKVSSLITEVFQDTDVCITVYSIDQSKSKTHVLKKWFPWNFTISF